MPPSSKSKASQALLNPLIVAILLLNTAGFFVLFFKTDLDTIATEQEVGLVRSQLEANQVRNHAEDVTPEGMQKRAPSTEPEIYHQLVESSDGKMALLGAGACSGLYGVKANPPAEAMQTFDLTYAASAETSDVNIGTVKVDLATGEATVLLSPDANVADCRVTPLISPAPAHHPF